MCLEYWIGRYHLKQLCALKRSQAHFLPRAWEAWDQESGMWPRFSTELLCSSNLVSLCLFPQLYQNNQQPTSQGCCEAKAVLCQGLGLMEGSTED